MSRNTCLCGSWSLAYGDAPAEPLTTIAGVESAGLPIVPAQVPGNFELDLQAAGKLPDPMVGMNMALLRPFERTHMWFTRRFQAEPDNNADTLLVFEGLDCYADVYLNGRLVGQSDNMLVEQRFPVDTELQTDNELVVHIRPAVVEAAKHVYSPGIGAMEANYESLYVRKAPSMYGWDIMPRALSGGMWRPVRLEQAPRERMETLYLQTDWADDGHAGLSLHYEVVGADVIADRYEIEIEGNHAESTFSAKKQLIFGIGRMHVGASKPHRWWPRGRGEQALYDVRVRLLKNGVVVDEKRFRHGIRTVDLRRSAPSGAGDPGEFCFIVNGERLYAMGSNWVPADAFHSRDRERIPQMLDLAEECGCNMLRCWGGNVYEDDLFYDLCDEKGLLIWQDFAMACALYPQNDEFCARMADEARKIVRRLRQHPCLALWSGDNECDQAFEWIRGRHGNPNTNRLTRKVIPDVLSEEDPRRPYLPSSPYLDETAIRLGEAGRPEDHLWGPRNYYKSAPYTHSTCLFASEIGYHGCPSPDSIRRFISPDKLWPPDNDNDEWLLHSTSPVVGANLYDYRIGLMSDQIQALFGVVPDNLDEYSRQSQYMQAEAFKFFIELFRAAKWRRTGMLWWNLIDGWPQFSDAVVDYYFDKKLAFRHIAASQQPLCLVAREPSGWNQEIVACNDVREDLAISFRVYDADTQETLTEGSRTVSGDQVTTLASLPARSSAHRFIILEWSSPLGRGVNHYMYGSPPFRPGDYRRWMAILESLAPTSGSSGP